MRLSEGYVRVSTLSVVSAIDWVGRSASGGVVLNRQNDYKSDVVSALFVWKKSELKVR